MPRNLNRRDGGIIESTLPQHLQCTRLNRLGFFVSLDAVCPRRSRDAVYVSGGLEWANAKINKAITPQHRFLS